MDKIKIRKIDVTADELFARIEKILEVSEKAYGKRKGTSLKELCSMLGIKELDFYEFRYDYKTDFNAKFIIAADDDYKPALIKLYRISTWNDPNRIKSRTNEFSRES